MITTPPPAHLPAVYSPAPQGNRRLPCILAAAAPAAADAAAAVEAVSHDFSSSSGTRRGAWEPCGPWGPWGLCVAVYEAAIVKEGPRSNRCSC